MDIYRKNEAYISRMNRRIGPVDERIQDLAAKAFGDRAGAPLFSLMDRDRTGIVELVYGMKKVHGSHLFQLLAVFSENERRPALVRNVIWVWGGQTPHFVSYGYDGRDYGNGYWCAAYQPNFSIFSDDVPMERFYRNADLVTLDSLTALDPSLRYCGWNSQLGIPVIDYLRLYRKHPRSCEMIARFGLARFLNEKALELVESEAGFARWIARNAGTLSARRVAPRTAYNAYRKNPSGDPDSYFSSLEYRCRCGREVAVLDRDAYDRVLKHTTQERLASYLRSNGINRRSYSDYIIACNWLRLDFSDTKVLFPHDFKAMHDLYVAQYADHLAEQEKISGSIPVSAGMRITAGRFSFLSDFHEDGYMVRVASSKEDLIREGAILHHCVGRMDYDKRQAKGTSVICFIRKKEAPDRPFVTAEVRIGEERLRVVQCYGDHDRVVPELNGFTSRWMRKANAVYRRISNDMR